jgi:hypothetical protein
MPAGAKEPVVVDYVENFPPDERAAGRWLNNRRRDLWAERIEHDHQGTIKLSALIGIALEARIDPIAAAAGKQIEASAVQQNGRKDGSDQKTSAKTRGKSAAVRLQEKPSADSFAGPTGGRVGAG